VLQCQNISKRLLPLVKNGGFSLPDHWVWDGSVVQDDQGIYHLFASRWSKAFPMHPGWVFKSEIVRATSTTLIGPYTFADVVFTERGSTYWDGKAIFNACVRRVGEVYLMFYTGTTYPYADVTPANLRGEDERYVTAQLNKRIGLAIAPSPAGPWTRSDTPILDVRSDCFDSALVSNPSPWVHADGSVLLIYKSRPLLGQRWGAQQLGVAYADHFSKSFLRITPSPLKIGGGSEIEDPHLWWQDDHYELIAKDMTGSITGEKNAAIHARSVHGLEWSLCEPAKAYSRQLVWNDGEFHLLGSMERPFVFLEKGTPKCLFVAAGDGTRGFSDATRTWIATIPLASE
jgi:hypothetical protein